jgi:hypothetical protein
MIDIAPASLGSVACQPERKASEADRSLLIGPSLGLTDRHVEITQEHLVTRPLESQPVEHLPGELNLPVPPIDNVNRDLPKGQNA